MKSNFMQLGMGSAVETLCGQAYGAHKYDMLGVYLQRSTLLLAATGVPLAIIYVYSGPILLLLGESEHIAAAAAVFVYGLIPQIFSYAANFPIQKFLQAQSIVAPSAYISAVTLLLHLALSWLVVYKLGLGLLGASLVLSLSWWLIVIAQFAYILTTPRCRDTWTGFTMQAFTGLWSFAKLSAASAVMLCLETWYLQILVLLAGLLDNPELSLDALSICMTLNGYVLMISIGFNAAASVRVGNELGAGYPRVAAFSVVVSTGMSFLLALIAAAIVMCLRDRISYLFTGGQAVAHMVSDLCPLLAITLILNGIQPVLSEVVRWNLLQPAESTKALWDAPVRNKVKVHAWRLVENGLAVGSELQRRKIKPGVVCVACGREESLAHRFLECPHSIFVLKVLQTLLGPLEKPPERMRNHSELCQWLLDFFGRSTSN
uniref:Uncharacterized protein n=1 Tax=Avena sativa TaxID=4498 RepID=A0ACD6APG7_AVESA